MIRKTMFDSEIETMTGKRSFLLTGVLFAVLIGFIMRGISAADSNGQQVFGSPAEAASAFVAAAKNDDLKALQAILGSDAQEIITSGDPVADNNARDEFVAKYNQMHRLAFDLRDRVILYVGADNWPLPIPITRQNDGWVFDTTAGKEEMLFRRVGRNELFTIDILQALGAAQSDYASEPRGDSTVKQFAQRIQSSPGKRDGLYWAAGKDEPQSPIGPLIADATAAGYQTGASSPIPFHGYYYKILTRQGKNAPGGRKNYIVKGKMTGGYAFLAYPATYRASGVMTFMVNQDGVLVQKDLGVDTVKLANEIVEYNPDKTWDQDIEAQNSSSPLWAELVNY
jgi:hypothetical protein